LIYPLKGKRDRALLGILLGCGVRRKETAELAVNDGIGIEPGG
jgi:site-specific recombinase XerD